MKKPGSAFILCVGSMAGIALMGCGDPGRTGLVERYRGKTVRIVNGDDVGITKIFTDATIDAYRKGWIGSAPLKEDFEAALKEGKK